MLEKEFQYYLKHQSELVEQYYGKYIVIINEQIVGSFNSFEEALNESIKKYKAGTFLVQECLPGEENYTQTFHSRVIFA